MRLFIVGALALLLWVSAAWSQVLVGRVVSIADGDTVTLLDEHNAQHRIRLAGIDAPEGKQAFGQRAKEYLASLVFGRMVEVETEKKDRYGRTVGKIFADGRDVNLALLSAGLAWHYKRYEVEQSGVDRLLYSRTEEAARMTQKGLWSENTPIPPWEWRKRSTK